MQVNGSTALMQSLIHEGVDTIFGYPGGAIMPVYDSLYHFKDKIRHILVRHEQAASHAAEGYARATGRAGVCMATSGPGATNLVTGIADAQLDSVPMVAITGQVFSSLLGTDAFQETDIIGITMPITKWNYQVTTPEEIPATIAKAFFIAQSGRPGPVLVDITKDAQVGMMDWSYEKVTSLPYYDSTKIPSETHLDKAAELIAKSKRPLVLVGHGVLISKAQEKLLEFAEKSGLPIACTLHGLSAFPTGHENYVGMLGMHGNYGPNKLTNEADLIIALGMRFDDRVTGRLDKYANQAKIIHVDVDPAEIGKNKVADVPLISDASLALEGLNERVKKGDYKEWFAKFKDCEEQEYSKVINFDTKPETGKLKMGEVVDKLSEATKGQAIVVADVGQHQMMAARYYKFNHPDSWITSGGLGTMGFALPAAFGAKVGAPDREVIAIIGDGGFQMTLQEMATIAEEKIPVKVIVLNNNFLGMVRQWQELFFDNRYSFVDLTNPDFITLAKGFHVEAERVESREQLAAGFKKMLDSEGPFFLEVMVEKEQNVFPMVPAGASVSEIRLE